MGLLVKIYLLSDPDTREARYVGSTLYLKERLYQHRAQTKFYENRSERKTPPLQRWMRTLMAADKSPLVDVLETCSDEERGEREDWWMDHLRNEGAILLNARKNGSKKY